MPNLKADLKLYALAIKSNKPMSILTEMASIIKERYGLDKIDLSSVDRAFSKGNNSFDINSYGKSGSRTMARTRNMEKVIK